MSMLTPPGMGGKNYRVTGDRYPRMRRPRRRGRTVFAVLGAVTVLALIAYGTVQILEMLRGDGSGERPSAAADRDCEPGATEDVGTQAQHVPLPEPTTITVNVYNATSRAGLAQMTADALEERGFTIGEVDNAPEELLETVDAPGLLLGSEAAQESGALTVVGMHLADASTGPADREDAEIDLLIGNEFEELAEAEAAEELRAAYTPPAPEPSPGC
ncbi:LytR C-terminal domain-containing protein [Streptomyces sp. ACA25]|uniref:LytR C-terminal domain-containing protein n=1 Tax=Streptomyces sp. ACA25 TaxID=3022596 RepID=UPI00230750DE|nr:LytR C-terminal domain-containing protein [Streptomyces sp. ACA25]MDB1086137.1 LytR C-terminal domain-containing protein [Streptomyces sp. ACA25]